MWVMSIIGVVWFSIALIFVMVFIDTDAEAAIGWGLLAILYAVPYSIVGIVTTKKKKESGQNSMDELMSLSSLKEQGILTDDEFQKKKQEILGA